MTLQLIHDENVKLLAGLESINVTLGKITNGPDINTALYEIAKKLEAMRNSELVAELESINVTLGKIANGSDMSKALGKIIEKLESIRDAIADSYENGYDHDDKVGESDKGTQDFLKDAFDKSTNVGRLLAAAGLNSLEEIADPSGISLKNQAKKIHEILKPHAESLGIELPGRGKLKDLVNHAREVLQEQQKKN